MRRLIVSFAVASLIALAVLSSVGADRASAQSKSRPKASANPSYGNADAISEEELRIYEYSLASERFEGRYFPSRGYDTAALYIASHLAEWGLKPGGSATGTNGPLQPYLMPIELVARQFVPEESKVTVTSPAPAGRGGANAASAPQTASYEYGKDWTTGGGRGGTLAETLDLSGNLVFAGNGYVIHKTNTNPYESLEIRGKIIVVAGSPPELAAPAAGRGAGGRGQANAQDQASGGRGRGSAGAPNPLGENCKDYFTPEAYAAANGALAVVSIANFEQLTAMASPAPSRGAPLNGPRFQVSRFQQTAVCPSAPSITAGLGLTNALFQGEKLAASKAFYAAGSNTREDSFELRPGKKLSLHLAVRAQPGHGENVVGIFEGSDPVLKNEYVVMSAHLDHLGLSAPLPDGHNVNNGADDNASGSASLLAIAHACAAGAAKGIRPKRSILFLWNGGEEEGLLGSRYFAQFPPIDLANVVANLNMDMIGRTKNASSVDTNATHALVKPGEVFLVGPNISSDDLEKTIETVNNNYQKLELNHFYDAAAPDATHDNLGPRPNGQRIFYRSDHYNFARMGIPIAFFTTGLHVDYHRPTDTPEKLDYQAVLRISKTVAAIGWELANQAGRPKLKPNLPDQLVRDMKTAQSQGWGKITPVLPPLPGGPH